MNDLIVQSNGLIDELKYELPDNCDYCVATACAGGPSPTILLIPRSIRTPKMTSAMIARQP